MTLARKIAKSAIAFEASQVSSLQVYKRLMKELKCLHTTSGDKQNSYKYRQSHSYKFFYTQFLHNRITDEQLCRPRNELLQRANDYATYLNSSRRLEELRAKYARGERSIEEAAAMCGLNLPSEELSTHET